MPADSPPGPGRTSQRRILPGATRPAAGRGRAGDSGRRGPSGRRRSGPAVALVLAFALLPAGRAGAQPGRDLNALAESLKSSARGELVKGRKIELGGDLAVIFMGNEHGGGWDYLKLKPEAARFLVENPKVDAPGGLTVRIVSLVASPATIRVGKGTGDGFRFQCNVEIAASGPVTPGSNRVVVSLPEVSDTARKINATRPVTPPSFEFVLEVFESEDAYLARARFDQFLYGLFVASPALPLFLMVMFARWRWRAIRDAVRSRRPAPESAAKPGRIATHLDPDAWSSAVRSSIEGLRRALEGRSEPVSRQLLGSLDSLAGSESTLSNLGREAATRAARTGELHSLLVTVEGRPVYILAFPELALHARLIRRYRGLADGWLAHASRVYRGLAGAASAPPLLCLLIFLAPDARPGRMAFAFEAADGRMATAEIVDGDPGVEDARPLVRIDGGAFPPAAPGDGQTSS